MKHTIVLEFETDKPIPEMLDLIAGRVYSLDRVVKGQVVATTLANYLYDVRKRVDVKPLPVVEQEPEWVGWTGGWGGPTAVHGDDRVRVRLRYGGELVGLADSFRWEHDMSSNDIVAYRTCTA